MTIEAGTSRPRRLRPVALVVAATLAVSLAGVTARIAVAGPSTTQYLTTSRAVDVVRTAFGSVAERPILEPQVVVAPTSAAIWVLSDDVNIANRAWNPRTARPWASGDARATWPEGMGGFTDPATGAVYVNAQTAQPSHVPHELLHANASPSFLLTVGVAVNEGVTERFALDALAVSRIEAEDAPAYAQERALAAAIEQLAGRDLLLQAYFNGGQALAEFVATIGPETLARVKNATTPHQVSSALAYVQALGR